MESFFNKIDLLFDLLTEVEILNAECSGVVVIRQGADGEFIVNSWTEFTVQDPENASKEFLEHLLPSKGWKVSPYSRARAREAFQRRVDALKELDIEL